MVSQIPKILKALDVDLPLVAYDENFISYHVMYQGKHLFFDFPSGRKRFEERLVSYFPSQKNGIRKFMEHSHLLFLEFAKIRSAPSLKDILSMPFTCPKTIKSLNRDFKGYLQGFGMRDPILLHLMELFPTFAGLPNEKCTALLAVGILFSLLEDASRTEGMFLQLPLALARKFISLGGEMRYATEVDSILHDGKKVLGIGIVGGTKTFADRIVSTVDVQRFATFFSEGPLPVAMRKYLGRIRNLEMTTSSFTVNIGLSKCTRLEGIEGKGYVLLSSGPGTFSKLYDEFRQDQFALSKEHFHIGLYVPKVGPGEKKTLSISTIPVAAESWITLRKEDPKGYEAKKKSLADWLVAFVSESILPGLEKEIVTMDIFTPATCARYSGSLTGSIYDMASTKGNFGMTRLPVKTPIKGLLQPKFAHGVYGAMNSGLQAADILLRFYPLITTGFFFFVKKMIPITTLLAAA